MEINFKVVRHPETDELLAFWEVFGEGGIITEGQTLVQLKEMIADATAAYFGDDKPLRHVKLSFKDDETRIGFAKDYFAMRAKDRSGNLALRAYELVGYKSAGGTDLHWVMTKENRRHVIPKGRSLPRHRQ